MTAWRSRVWPPSRIALRLLAFNLLVMFVPVVGVLYLDVYEDRLLQAQEREMVHQGRLLAAAIPGDGRLDPSAVQQILVRLERQNDARFHVYDMRGVLIADSARVPISAAVDAPIAYSVPASAPDIRRRLLYRLGAWMAGARRLVSEAGRAIVLRDSPEAGPDRPAGGVDPELGVALGGRYGAATRHTPGQRSLTLFSAVPVRHGDAVIGAVVVSQSTFRTLQALYDVRLGIFQVVVASVAAAALLTTLAAMTIVRPLRRLRRQATAFAERRGPLPPAFPGSGRRDEIGDLARALEELTRRLDDHIGLLEGFAADVSHEFKNPLASIRTAAEVIASSDRPEERDRFLDLMLRDIGRLERLVSGVREMARIDRQLEHEGFDAVRVTEVIREVIQGLRAAGASRAIVLDAPGEAVVARGSREHLVQVFENLLSNAVGFAPENTTVEVAVTQDGTGCRVTVGDRGPGIPEAHLRRVFDRFFTYRPMTGRGDHVGLGLSIARRIVEGCGGTISVSIRTGGGAVFEVRLPVTATSGTPSSRAPAHRASAVPRG